MGKTTREPSIVSLLGVEYVKTHSSQGGDLYFTKYGTSFMEQLQPEHWLEGKWFKANRERLPGTSTVYRVPTREVDGRSLELVIKYCRVGEEVPLDTVTFDKFWDTEFNTPYEEFSLLMELREDPSPKRILTNRPLAIYVPPERMKAWQTGRSKHRIARKTAKFRDVELDIFQQYILIYEWVKGEAAPEALGVHCSDQDNYRKTLEDLTYQTRDEMAEKGFMVVDHKPAHIILRPRSDGSLLRKRSGDLAYALVDFELLVRTPQHERIEKATRRRDYFWHLGHRFAPPSLGRMPEHLTPTQVFDIDYIYGHAQSTAGSLWVLGKDPKLFDYFLPERWRHTPSEQLSDVEETFYTVSKDGVHVVWKVSSVGEIQKDHDDEPEDSATLFPGYNSPFEEFAIALELSTKGVSCIYPRAIYMAGISSPRAREYVWDNGRYQSHKGILTPEGEPVLRPDHNYLTVWGYWRSHGDDPEGKGILDWEGMDLSRAADQGLLPASSVPDLVDRFKDQVSSVGFDANNLKPKQLLVSVRPDKRIIELTDGYPRLTLCNFETIRRAE